MIYADGDLDGLVSAVILSKKLKIKSVHFPPPDEWRSKPIRGEGFFRTFLLELSPSKGVLHTGELTLIDHHTPVSSHGRIALVSYRDGKPIHKDEGPVVRSLASGVARLFPIRMEDELKRAVVLADIADSPSMVDPLEEASQLGGNYERLMMAYEVNKSDQFFRQLLFDLMRDGEWDLLFRWVNEEAIKFKNVEMEAERLARRAEIRGGVAFVEINGTGISSAAKRRAMFHLYKEGAKYVFFLAWGRGYVGVSVGKSPVYKGKTVSHILAGVRKRVIRNRMGWFSGGGRESVGGFKLAYKGHLKKEKLIRVILDEVEARQIEDTLAQSHVS